MAKTSLFYKIYNSGPLLLLYYLCISEVDTNLEKIFEIFTLNFQIILIYFWIIKRPSLMGTGHIFSAGLINDVVMGFPLGISSLSYLVVCFVGNYVRNKSVNTTIASAWFTFLIALLLYLHNNNINCIINNRLFFIGKKFQTAKKQKKPTKIRDFEKMLKVCPTGPARPGGPERGSRG